MFAITAIGADTIAIRLPADSAHHKFMGRFEAARRTDSGRYLLPISQVTLFIEQAQQAGWEIADEREPATATPPHYGTCPRCGNLATEPNHAEHCSRRATPETAHHYATLARNAAKAGAIVAKARARNQEGP